ncbi:unnamed protein product [Arctia plantaginis]|uniref:Uncharacterized protein n=1 Tax=Arctia plantaginis TaxID=874455 RepID=A0A8S1B4B1_ARCPL|nr:unnamed protein product [Arctia plantaginis]
MAVRAAVECLGVRGEGKTARGYEWWSPALEALHRSNNKARKDWQRQKRRGIGNNRPGKTITRSVGATERRWRRRSSNSSGNLRISVTGTHGDLHIEQRAAEYARCRIQLTVWCSWGVVPWM